MTTSRVFFIYMALVGIATGAILVAAPAVMDFWLKPYFWVLLALVLFDVGAYLRRRSRDAMVPKEARLLGFVIGIAAMVAVPTLAGSPARFF